MFKNTGNPTFDHVHLQWFQDAWEGTKGGWEEVGSSENVVNINEDKTESFWSNLGNLQDLYQSQAGGFFQEGGGFGDIWNSISGATSPLQQSMSQYYKNYLPQMVEQGIAGVQQLGGANAGVAGKIAAGVGGQAASQMQQQMLAQQLGMLGPLAQGAQQGNYGMLGQILGQQGQAAAPTYWEPSYYKEEDKPGWLQQAVGGALQGGMAGLMTGNPWAALGGAAGGGLMGGLGLQDSGYGSGALVSGGIMNLGERQGWWGNEEQGPVYDDQNQYPTNAPWDMMGNYGNRRYGGGV